MLDLLRPLAQVMFLACFFAAGYHLPVLVAERRFRRGAVRLGESFPHAIRRAERWRWLTAPLGLLVGLILLGMTV